ncbi:type II toxin-antitoxin system PemK/MazF family toxin [Streptomyces sp. H10-C2]|uniref:type II toxin-antitoxin system PemK/MazF family toxin n=1 Tax=unclassified Streptomyces TaxID=2593676 RepID=UPI0024BAA2B5|nr:MULTISPECIES: type II toxin-antitoxin system PemK/MazF family toxin [unclassified Streptomyces]MDJ0344394.1 type II toxin-antitoxin system PemK/MazF family toxin [Streptomyces sp. PH10-H1]MDJ0373763.1 type II toxin-antitoxin system PemK/MazF family toxin [Streptomyces sp. H10-C2]
MDMTWWWVAAAAVVVVAVLAAWARTGTRAGSRIRARAGARGGSRAGARRRPGGPTRPPRAPGRPGPLRGGKRAPAPGEIWWADVPFEDGPGSKDRPCLVLSVHKGTVRVAKITSRHHEELPGVIALPPGAVGDTQGRTSYLETDELRDVRSAAFRRRAGALDAALWQRVQRMTR